MKHKLIYLSLLAAILCGCSKSTIHVFISPDGDDTNSGTIESPFATLNKAMEVVKEHARKQPVTINLREGTYYIASPIEFIPATGGNVENRITFTGYKDEKAIISTAKVLKGLNWQPYKDGIFQTQVKGVKVFDQLFVNGEQQHLARYPNYNPQVRHFNGFAADAISPERVKNWQNPVGGIVHAMHRHEWGGYHYMITGKNAQGKLTLEGGFQNNRQIGMHSSYRMVENILEELDTVNEWFYNADTETLYYYPPTELDLQTAVLEVPQLESIFTVKGTAEKPVFSISINKLELKHTLRTFMKTSEPLLRSDWAIYRGGAIYIEGARSCHVSDCVISDVGGNAIFFSGYNRGNVVEKTHIFNAGASGICLVGSPDAVRSPSFEYSKAVSYEDMDLTPGPATQNYPNMCIIEENLIHNIGTVEKQVAGVQISMAEYITVSHNSIYNLPRAGINISEGTFGGHIIEWNDVFNTVLETGDHGSFNSWGRDRFWISNRRKMDSLNLAHPELASLDIIAPTVIRYNRWRCDHGWDIDLDDGSSNYHIYGNLCLSGGLKLREGFNRTVENNIIVNNSFHPHVWFRNSGDIFRYNIVTRPYYPIGIRYWGKEVDHNLFADKASLEIAQSEGTDKNSIAGDPLFVSPETGNYQVRENSPALLINFKNFDMDKFGVTYEKLKVLAATPLLPVFLPPVDQVADEIYTWNGVSMKTVTTESERSATGLDKIRGVLIVMLDRRSPLKKAGMETYDVLLKFNNREIENIDDLKKEINKTKKGQTVDITLFSNQKENNIRVTLP